MCLAAMLFEGGQTVKDAICSDSAVGTNKAAVCICNTHCDCCLQPKDMVRAHGILHDAAAAYQLSGTDVPDVSVGRTLEVKQ